MKGRVEYSRGTTLLFRLGWSHLAYPEQLKAYNGATRPALIDLFRRDALGRVLNLSDTGLAPDAGSLRQSVRNTPHRRGFRNDVTIDGNSRHIPCQLNLLVSMEGFRTGCQWFSVDRGGRDFSRKLGVRHVLLGYE